MSKKRSRRRFTDEFKAETVKLVKQSDRTMSDIAMELGISAKHILGYSGTCLLLSVFCCFLVWMTTSALAPRFAALGFLLALLATYRQFFKLYDKGDREYQDAWFQPFSPPPTSNYERRVCCVDHLNSRDI